MIKIGLCGGSGSGKGTVSAFFSERGYLTLDTDKICHELFSGPGECTDELRLEFGDSIFNASCSVNRKKLSEIVFSNQEKLERLNQISHYYILKRVREIIEANASNHEISGFVIDAPLLFESKFDSECDLVVAVVSDRERRIERIIERDNISRERAISRINNQLDDGYLISHSDFVIENNGSIADLKKKTMFVIDKIENNCA